MDRTDYPFEVDEWLRRSKERMSVATDFIGDHPYRHFDARVSHQDLDTNQSKLIPILKNPELLVKHSFFPFLRKDKKTRQFTRNRATRKTKIGQKLRPIMYASHRDACIYAFYSYLLKQAYEKRIKNTPLNESVIAYRHIPRDAASKRGKSNIDFAKDVYYLTSRRSRCAVLCLDISKFFDTMDHKIIKEKWIDLLSVDELPPNHYTVFRNVTNYRYVFLQDALVRLNLGRFKKGKFTYYGDAPRSGPLCSPEQYRAKIDPKLGSLVHKHRKGMGVPQGCPISDIIANIYLEGFDRAMLAKLDQYNFGHYRRYSDDILIICPEEKVKEIYKFACDNIKQDRLTIKAKKTEAVIIDNVTQTVRDITYHVTGLEEHKSYTRQAFQYLGFEIDAIDMHIRSGTVAAHYRRAKRRARASAEQKTKIDTVKRRSNKKNRSRWQYFISARKRTRSTRIGMQYKKVLKRVHSFSNSTASPSNK